jgi:hypothetical protein
VFALARAGLQLDQLALDLLGLVDAAHVRDRQVQVAGGDQAVRAHHDLLEWETATDAVSFKHKACPLFNAGITG